MATQTKFLWKFYIRFSNAQEHFLGFGQYWVDPCEPMDWPTYKIQNTSTVPKSQFMGSGFLFIARDGTASINPGKICNIVSPVKKTLSFIDLSK